MQHICSFLELHCVHGTVGITSVILYDFENSGTCSLPRLRLAMLSTKLCNAESDSNLSFTASGKSSKSVLADPIQKSAFSPEALFDRAIISSQF